MTKGNLRKLSLLILISMIWFTGGWFLHSLLGTQHEEAGALSVEQQQILKAQNLLLNHQLHNFTGQSDRIVTAQSLTEAAIEGMVHQSNDPYADLYGPAAAMRYVEDATTTTGVPGFWFDIINKKMVVTKVSAGSSAEEAGVQVGDILVSADGILFDETISGNEASILQRGPVGSTLTLTVLRGEQTLTFRIVRQERHMLSSQIIDGHIGYVDLDYISVDLEKSLKKELQLLDKQGIDTLIWDLRGNYGGSVEATVKILSYFIEEGKLFTIELSDGSRTTFTATGDAFLPKLPIIILIDRHTVSAAEIVTAAMMEHKRAISIGQTSTGKGTIQDTVPLGQSYLLHFTVAKWFTPSNKWIHRIGSTPTILVEDDPTTDADEILNFAIDYVEKNLLQNKNNKRMS